MKASQTTRATRTLMIALMTEAACGHCPLSVRCMQGKGFLDLYAEPHINYRVRHCRRCYAVLFEYEHTTYICGLIRWGLNFSADPTMRDGYEKVWKRIGTMHSSTRGCGLIFPHDHPLTHSKPGVRGRKRKEKGRVHPGAVNPLPPSRGGANMPGGKTSGYWAYPDSPPLSVTPEAAMARKARKRILDRMGMFADLEEPDERALEEDGYDDRDCFVHLRASITETF